MYLHQSYHLKHKLPPRAGLRLPSLEWLRKANSRAIIFAMPMLGLGILSGIVLNLTRRGPQSGGVAWNDPAVLSTSVMFAWLLIAVMAGLFYRPAREGHKVVYVTVVSFVFLVIALGLGLLINGGHGDLRARRGSQSRSSVKVGREITSVFGTLCRQRPPWRSVAREVTFSEFPERHGGRCLQAEVILRPHLSQERPWA